MKCRPTGNCLHPPPVSLRHLSLCPTSRTFVCCRYRASLITLLPPSAYTQVPVVPWGVRQLWVPQYLCVPAFSSPSSPQNLGIVWYLFFCLVAFRAKSRFPGASNPRQLHALVLFPPATWPCRRHSGYPDPPSPPPCCRDLIPVSS